MAVSLTVNGIAYSFPNTGDQTWGDNVTNWATAVSNNMVQKTGGSFPLTGDLNFGSSFGLLAKYFTSVTANPATAGFIRAAKSDTVDWRNNANTANLVLGIDANNLLKYQGFPIRFSVTDFGATGDGSTDDTTAIKNCIAATSQLLSINCLAEVYFPATRNGYVITDTLTISTNLRLCGDNSGQSFLVYTSASAKPMITVTVDPSVCIIERLGFNNTGAATMAIQCNASHTWISNVRSNPTVKFSTCFISTQQASTYSNNVTVIDSQFLANAAGNETPIGIWFVDGFSMRAVRCFFSGILVGIKAASGSHGGIDNFSATDCHYETFDGATGPGSNTDIGIDVAGVYGVNITGFSADLTTGGQRCIRLGNFAKGGSITGGTFTTQGASGSAGIKISGGANVQNVVIQGNEFYDFALAGIEVTAANSLYFVGTNNANSGSGLVLSDAFSPPLGKIFANSADGLPTAVSPNTTSTKKFLRQTGTGSVSAAPAWDTIVNADLPTVPAFSQLEVGAGATGNSSANTIGLLSVSQNGATITQIQNANAGGSASAQLRVTSNQDTLELVAYAAAAATNALLNSGSGFTGGLFINQAGTNPIALQTNSLTRATVDGSGNVAVGTAAIATNATDGFFYIPTCAGAPTGVPTAKTGRAPMVYDTVNHKFWMYDGAWKGVVLS